MAPLLWKRGRVGQARVCVRACVRSLASAVESVIDGPIHSLYSLYLPSLSFHPSIHPQCIMCLSPNRSD